MRLKSTVKPKKKNLINFKATDLEMTLIQKKADKYAGGNVSEWLRYAAIQLDPRASDLTGSAPVKSEK